jgi:hypothetical protein
MAKLGAKAAVRRNGSCELVDEGPGVAANRREGNSQGQELAKERLCSRDANVRTERHRLAECGEVGGFVRGDLKRAKASVDDKAEVADGAAWCECRFVVVDNEPERGEEIDETKCVASCLMLSRGGEQDVVHVE